MNRAALLTVGRKLQGDNMYLLSVFDLEPSGVIVHAYNQSDSKEYILPVTELEVVKNYVTTSRVYSHVEFCSRFYLF